jgi:arylsulfatase A-like enzyme
MVTGPDIPEDSKVQADVYLQDIMATSLQLAGIEKPSQVFFNSFLDLAQGKQQKSHYPAIYGAYMDFQRMIRKDGYKLLVYPRVNKVLLFDMENDPNEMNDLSDNPEYAVRVKSLLADLMELQEEMQDPLVLSHMLPGDMGIGE